MSVLALGLLPISTFAAVHYVKADGTGNGSSWTEAAGNLQSTIDAAQAGDEIWVAQGVYKPETLIKSNKKTSKAFILKDGVSLYGGFIGTESNKDQRAITKISFLDIPVCANITLLDANDDVEDVWIRSIESGTSYRYTWGLESNVVTGTKNNSTHVLYCANEFNNETVIDGFTIKGGNANVWNVKAHGGAVYAIGNVHISQCRIIENSAYFTAESTTDSNSYGGAVYLDAKGKGSISDCYFESTYCHSSYGSGVGGAVYVKNGAVDFCYFKNCVATDFGGAISAHSGSKITDCVAENCYSATGGAFYIDATSSVEHCVANSCRGLLGGGFTIVGSATHCVALNCYADAPEFQTSGGGQGGGFYLSTGSILGCVAYNNQAYNGGGIVVESGKVVNTTAMFNVLRDGTTKNNIEGRELDGVKANIKDKVFNTIYETNVERSNFVNCPTFDGRATNVDDSLALVNETDLSLARGSRFIDAGTFTEGFFEMTDILDNPRIVGNSIDVGAYEYQGDDEEPTPNIVITFAEGTQVARIGVGGVDGYEFYIDWGDGDPKEYSKAAYYSGSITGNQVKVYGSEVNVLYLDNQNVVAVDLAKAPLLQRLQSQNTKLTVLDISKNTELTGVYVTGNKIAQIDLSNNKKLRVIDISGNNLSGKLDCSALAALSKVDCSQNQLTELVLPHHSTVFEVLCNENKLTTLDLSGLTGLNEVSCYGNQLTTLYLDGLTSLENVYAYDNKISSIVCKNSKSIKSLNLANNEISEIDMTQFPAVEGVYLYDNALTALDISNNPAIRWLNIENNRIYSINTSAQTNLTLFYADNNQLSAVDFSNNRSLMQLKLANNQLSTINLSMLSSLSNCQLNGNKLSTIDLSKNGYLYWLNIADNNISSLDLSNNTFVQWVAAENNKLTVLDLANNKGLQGLTLQGNNMNVDAINAVISQLQDVSSVTVDDTNREWARKLNISYMPGTEAANVDNAKAKGWYVTAEKDSSVGSIDTDDIVVSREYITIGGVVLGTEVPESGLYIEKTVYGNGTVKYNKVSVVK